MAAQVILIAMMIYLLAGICFGVVFVAFLVRRLDPAATHAPLGFRLIILPGCCALWPVLLRKCLKNREAS